MRLVSSPSPKPALVTPRSASSSATRARQPGSCSWNTQARSSVANCTMCGPSDASPCTKVGLDSVSKPQALAPASASQAWSAWAGVATSAIRSRPRRSKGSSSAIWSLSGVGRWAVRAEGWRGVEGGWRRERGESVMRAIVPCSWAFSVCRFCAGGAPLPSAPGPARRQPPTGPAALPASPRQTRRSARPTLPVRGTERRPRARR